MTVTVKFKNGEEVTGRLGAVGRSGFSVIHPNGRDEIGFHEVLSVLDYSSGFRPINILPTLRRHG